VSHNSPRSWERDHDGQVSVADREMAEEDKRMRSRKYRLYAYSFIHSGYFKSTTRKRSRHSTDMVLEFHAEAPQATAG